MDAAARFDPTESEGHNADICATRYCVPEGKLLDTERRLPADGSPAYAPSPKLSQIEHHRRSESRGGCDCLWLVSACQHRCKAICAICAPIAFKTNEPSA